MGTTDFLPSDGRTKTRAGTWMVQVSWPENRIGDGIGTPLYNCAPQDLHYSLEIKRFPTPDTTLHFFIQHQSSLTTNMFIALKYTGTSL